MKKIQKEVISLPDNLFSHELWLLTPRSVWIVGTCNEDGSPNLCTITCVSYTPGPPASVIISMISARRTAMNILRTGEFTVNLGNSEMASLADYVGSVSGNDVPKTAVPYDFTWGEKIHAPVLDASPCVIECKVLQTHPLGDFHTFFGEMANLHMDLSVGRPKELTREEVMEWFNSIDIHKIDPLVYHSALKYYRVGEKVIY